MSMTLVGRDTLVINGRVIHDFAHGVYANLTFEASLLNMQISKDGNVLLQQNLQGEKAKLSLRLAVGSFDDQYLSGLLQAWINDPASFSLISGSFAKRVGDGQGGVKNVVYQLAAGAFTKIPSANADTDGGEAMSVAEYEMFFVLQNRAIQ